MKLRKSRLAVLGVIAGLYLLLKNTKTNEPK